MSDTKREFENLGIIPPDILLPNKDVDLQKWAVVACDQYTSEPEYWESVDDYVKESPSTLRLIYPETFLDREDHDKRIADINRAMVSYLEQGLFDEYKQTFFLVHRKTKPGSPGRWGLLAAVDLEAYDFSQGSKSLIRATEGTILERIPPRKAIRKDAPLEFPHILVLIDDPEKTVIKPLADNTDNLEMVYQSDLMKNSGSITAYAVSDDEQMKQIASALSKLADAEAFKQRYGTEDVLLYAMGDGNHSLATAKSCWEDIKSELGPQDAAGHPARYALVEIENIYDEGIEFEPIHRVMFNASRDDLLNLIKEHTTSFEIEISSSLDELYKRIHTEDECRQFFGLIDSEQVPYLITVTSKEAQIAAGTLQHAIDEFLLKHPASSVDYTHGLNVTASLGMKPGNIGLFLPALRKDEFFTSIVKDGALPRKTFSMGEDFEKRFYIEGRKIR
jgi:hypothetical protein